jgi:hypothetical protein
MKSLECDFEPEVLALVVQSGWPDRADAALREHAAGCVICSDVAAVAGAIDRAREEMREAAAVPDSGSVWWRAQLRARREAARNAGRPITAVQVIALACAMGLLGACFGATSAWFQSALAGVKSSLASMKIQALLPSATALIAGHGVLILAMAALLLLLPAAVYLAMLRE